VRATVIHVTDHALSRWKQRVSNDERLSVYTIIDVVKKARVVKKQELLPFRTPRIKNSLYAVYQNILFIMESINIDEYNLVTIITENNLHTPKIAKNKKVRNRFVPEKKKKRKKLPARNKKVIIESD
jgi:hypothetical protein